MSRVALPCDAVRQWLARYDPEVVEYAIRDVAPKTATGFIKQTQWLPYAWAVCRNFDAQAVS
jgi:hypothetical protein